LVLGAALLGAMIAAGLFVARRVPSSPPAAETRPPEIAQEVAPTPGTAAPEKTIPAPPPAPTPVQAEAPSVAAPPEEQPPVFLAAPPIPFQHQLSPGLWGEYFDVGEDLATFPDPSSFERPVMRRIDVDIDFARALRSFAKAEFTVSFYVRWTGRIRIQEKGTVRFSTLSDDGSRVYIDGRQVVDNGGLHVMLEARGDVELAPGDHDLRVEFFQNFQYAGCKFSWERAGGPKEIVPESLLFHPSPQRDGELVPGLVGEYFESGHGLSDFPDPSQWSRPALTRVDRRIDFGSTPGAFAGVEFRERFYARWLGRISIPKRGIYRFFTESDDGSRLLIDGRLVVDNGGLHEMQEAAGQVALEEGAHDLQLEYFQNKEHAGLRLLWQTDTGAIEVIPREAFSHVDEAPSLHGR
jgi:hypothetical protein